MRHVFLFALVAGSVASVAYSAPKPASIPASQQVLKQGIDALVAPLAASGSAKSAPAQPKTTDHDQGDDHASDTAILKVCSHDNPSAQRSAICPHPISPD